MALPPVFEKEWTFGGAPKGELSDKLAPYGVPAVKKDCPDVQARQTVLILFRLKNFKMICSPPFLRNNGGGTRHPTACIREVF